MTKKSKNETIVKNYERLPVKLDFSKEFLDLWSKYPKKIGKKPAYKAYKMLLRENTHDEIEKATMLYLKEKEGTDLKYIKQGGSFFVSRIYDYLDMLNEKPKEFDIVCLENKEVDEMYKELNDKLNKIPYEQYLQTKHWKYFKNQAIYNSHNSCELCGESFKTLHVHHRDYCSRGRETFNDVIVLCIDCHLLAHKSEGAQ